MAPHEQVMAMTLDSLKIFCDVVRQRSFSRGALVNGVSQSAASQAVSQIEKRLGVKLIDRSKRPFSLTAEGRVYYEGCRDLMDRYLAVETQAKAMRTEAANQVLVASIYSVGLYDMNQYVRRFLAHHPNGNVRLDYLHPDKVYEKVLAEEADLGLISFPRSLRELEVIPWRKEPMVVVCHPSHRFASATELAPADLSGEDFVAADEDLTLRRHVDRYLREHHVKINVVMAFDNIEAIKRGIEIDAGISILPAPTVRREVANGSLAIAKGLRLDLIRPLGIVHRRGRPLTPAIESFIELLKGNHLGLTSETGNGERAAQAQPLPRPSRQRSRAGAR
ncbi:MAG: LysR family transcriptional regulator [Phycisphaerae bacterium]|nr:LysR family transcriptional regulator [Phycisphaerae bacterium]